MNLLEVITSHLNSYGFIRNGKGFFYIREGIQLMLTPGWGIHTRVTSLYEVVAENNNTSAQAVERCIRHSIQTTYKKHPDLFVHYSSAPATKEFLFQLMDEISMKL